MSINETQKIEEANKRVNVPVTINGRSANALIDTGSTLPQVYSSNQRFLYSKSLGMCQVNLKLLGQEYKNVSATVLKNLITDVILGRDFMTQHQSININFGGVKPTLQLGAL